MRLHPAGDQVHGLHRAKGTAPVLHQLAITAHGAQPLAQRFLLAELAQIEVADQLIDRHRAAARLQHRQNQLTAGNGIFVTGLLIGEGAIFRLPIGLRAAAATRRFGRPAGATRAAGLGWFLIH